MYSARVSLVLASAARSLPKTQHGVRFGFCKMRRAACIRKKPNYGEIIEKLAFHWVWNERQQHNTRQAAVRVVVQSAQGVLHRPRKLSRKGNPGPPVCGFALKMSACRELQLACTARPLSAWSLFLHCCQGKKKNTYNAYASSKLFVFRADLTPLFRERTTRLHRVQGTAWVSKARPHLPSQPLWIILIIV